LGDPPIIRVRSPDEARALARRELASHPNFVKFWFVREPGDDLAAKEAIVRAAADETHAAGVRFAVHATELETAKAALRAGADILVHSVFDAPVDVEFLELAKKHHAIYIPTLAVRMGYQFAFSGQWQATAEELARGDPQVLAQLVLADVPKSAWPERVRKAVEAKQPVEPSTVALANLMAVQAAGIPIATGTDAGNIGTLHGPGFFREVALMTKAGMSPLDILRASTVEGARVLGKEAELGDVAPGKAADLVVLAADPLAASANLARTVYVIRRGRVYQPGELTPSH
jgi:imidazolonepropionase-like amidohydrolase